MNDIRHCRTINKKHWIRAQERRPNAFYYNKPIREAYRRLFNKPIREAYRRLFNKLAREAYRRLFNKLAREA